MPDELTAFATRLTPARPDLAAAHLRGRVTAERFAEGIPRRVTEAVLDLTATPEPGAGLETQLLCGEGFTVYEERADGLAWGQSDRDGYVGYVATSGLGPDHDATRAVTALWSQIYREPKVRSRTMAELPHMALLSVSGREGGFVALAGGGFVPVPHLEPVPGDFVAQASRYLGVPYLWGGRSARGLDCSALVQLAMIAVGGTAPRDADMQEAGLGRALADDEPGQRGDLIFWRGHVGFLEDAETLLHANGHHMRVAREPLAGAAARIAEIGGGPVTCRRRVIPD